jgi:hypothetical protein
MSFADAPARQRRQKIERRGIGPVQVLEHEQQRFRYRNRLERLADLTQHSLARGAENLLLKFFAKLRRNQGGELREPRRRVRGEHAHHALTARPAT